MGKCIDSFAITHSVPLIFLVIWIISTIATIGSITEIFSFSKLYAIPSAVFFGFIALTLVVMSAGYITLCINNKTWFLTYTIYYCFTAVCFLITIILFHMRDGFVITQLKLDVEMANRNKATPYKYLMANLSCWGYTGCSEEECGKSYTHMPTNSSFERCDVAGRKKFDGKIKQVLIFCYITFGLIVLHIIEMIWRLRAFKSDSNLSDSSTLSRFVQIT